jgi:DNA invertase Pin-like site-specific DNA recombinase
MLGRGADLVRVVAYYRVSTDVQGASGYGLEAQRDRVTRECSSRGWEIVHEAHDIASAKSLDRIMLTRALGMLQAGEADALMVSRLDRLSRSVGDFAALLDRAIKEDWQLITLDPHVDTTTPYGRAMANMAAVFAQLERELISQRTREGLAMAGPHPRLKITPEVGEVIVQLREAGMSQAYIGRQVGVSQPCVSKYLRKVRQR